MVDDEKDGFGNRGVFRDAHYAGEFNRAVEKHFRPYEEFISNDAREKVQRYCEAVEKSILEYGALMEQAIDSMDEDEQGNLQASFVDMIINEVSRLEEHNDPEEFQVNYAAVYSLLDYAFGYIDETEHLYTLSLALTDTEQHLRNRYEVELEERTIFDPNLIKEAADMLFVYAHDFQRQTQAVFYSDYKPNTLH